MNNFSSVLKELIDDKNVSVKFLAKYLELSSVSIVYKWIKNKISLLLPTAIKTADFFNCSLDYLFRRSYEYGSGNYNICPPFDVQFRKVIKEQNISQNRLIKDKVVSRGNLNCWLNKKQTPHIESIIKLANYLKVSMDYLVGREK